MARKKTEKKSEAGGFGKMFAWTVVLGIVFSAGLITGQRLLRQQALAPMVSLSTSRTAALPPEGEPAPEKKALRTTFSFYEHLTAEPEPKEAPHKPAETTAAETKPVEAKPVEAQPVEAQPEPAKAVAAVEPAPKEAKPEPVAEPAPPSSTVGEAVETLQKAVESLTEEPDAEALPARYTLQVSSHPDRDSAERELGRLRQVGVEPHVVVVDVPGRGKLFRIHVGKFHTMDEARAFQGGLREKRGVAGFVTPL